MENDHTAERKSKGLFIIVYIAWVLGIATAAAIYAGINPIAAITISAVWVYLLSKC